MWEGNLFSSLTSFQVTLGSASPDWVDKNSHTIQDWVEDVEGDSRDLSQQYHREKEYDREFRDSEGREYDRPSRPNSRDSRVSKESRGSKESKGINLFILSQEINDSHLRFKNLS